jgi:predicted ferric reductase
VKRSRVLGAWYALLTVAILTPIVLTVTCGSGDPATVWSALAVMTGSMALIALVFTLVAVARVRYLTNHLGIDGAMGIHRTLGVATVGLATAHILAVVADNPANVWLLDPSIAPGRAVAGTLALITLALILGFAEKRIRHYEWWRWAHRLGAAIALGLIGLHVWLLNRLIEVPQWAALFALAAVVAFGAGVWRWLAPDRRKRFVVAEVRDEGPTVSTLVLIPTGEPLRFEAGQFAWIRLHAPSWAEDHPFTMSSTPDDEWLEFTIRHTGDWTTGPLRKLRPGSPVWLDGPHGGLTLASADTSSGLVMIAAGVGLTPVMSVLRTAAIRGDTRPMHVLTPVDEPLFRAELADLRQHLDLTVQATLPRPVDATALAARLPWIPRAAYFVSGPPRLVDDTCAALHAMEIPSGRIHSERFMLA